MIILLVLLVSSMLGVLLASRPDSLYNALQHKEVSRFGSFHIHYIHYTKYNVCIAVIG